MAMSIGNPRPLTTGEKMRRQGIVLTCMDEAVMQAMTAETYVIPQATVPHQVRGPRWSYSDMTEERRTKRVIRRQRTQ